MTETETAWLAGLLEGEGCFLFATPSQYKSNVAIQVQMTDEDVVSKVAKLFGVSYWANKSPKNPKWKRTYSTRIKGRKAVELMRAVLPYMGIRRTERISEVLKSAVFLPRFRWAPKITAEIREYIFERHAAGWSGRKIARDISVHHATIQNILHGKFSFMP